ncbi:MAG: Tn3 family transposase, partial [Actinomycetia bacterium]|nr:Tn3 family transposase [Actinomycetes bacterium]
RHLAQVARRLTPAALRRMSPQRRYPMLLAFLAEAHSDLVDELVLMFDQALSGFENRTRRLVHDQQLQAAQSSTSRLELLDDILDVVLDSSLDDSIVGRRLRGFGTDRLHEAVRPEHERSQPVDGGHLALIEDRYTQIRGFAPHVLDAVQFNSSIESSETLEAVEALVRLNESNQRHVPADAPVGFVPARWRSYLTDQARTEDPTAFRHHWELAVLYELRAGLRSGEIWVEGSRRYANPATYLLPTEIWPYIRPEALAETGRAETFAEQLTLIEADTSRLLDDLEELLADPDSPVSIDNDGQLHLQRLPAESVPAEVTEYGEQLAARLPAVPLAELMIEIDHATRFTDHLTHANNAQPRHSELEHRRNLLAAILAQACNFGVTRMAELSGISADTLTWTTRWYLREDTLRAANAAIVNTHHQHPLAQAWGGGTLSSSDGLRLPIRSRSLTARALSRYFTDQGGTSYTHVSDQHTTYGTQIIVTTDRDATYVLDEILGNTTDLPIDEHTTDTHGQTLLTFALFDLVGLRLSPRIARLTKQRLWRSQPKAHYRRWPTAGPLLAHPLQTEIIERHWDDLLRIAWSIRTGHVSASLLITRLQAGARQHPLAKALLEYGKLQRTNHALRWFTDEAFRRRIGRQLNRGESLNGLRRYLFFAQQAEISHRHHEDQTAQAHCHTLATNACVLWTTHYLGHAINDTEIEVPSEVIAHLSPARFKHINPYGTYTFNEEALRTRPHRPLRPPQAPR